MKGNLTAIFFLLFDILELTEKQISVLIRILSVHFDNIEESVQQQLIILI